MDLKTTKERHELIEKKASLQTKKLPDLQAQEDNYFFALDFVGITDFKLPLLLKNIYSDNDHQTVLSTWKAGTTLRFDQRGTHMSRLSEELTNYARDSFLSLDSLFHLVQKLEHTLLAKQVEVSCAFIYFFPLKAPLSERSGFAHVWVELSMHTGGLLLISLKADIATLCPCSKEISNNSAHNQRGVVQIQAETVFIEQLSLRDLLNPLVQAVLENASTPLYPILKREDEKFLTESAYKHPRFTEDISRLVAASIYENTDFSKVTVSSTNFESIHQHNATSRCTYEKVLPS